ncbi:hypothetical protein [Pedobacter punctiformis]|uniref:Uncharacterized protein n=1 Tax=Pedobacter punctiformis TaxID=3004097 RepID=A0ABT4LAM1_9SPHI|nr:hypothetical protein [Pedobacter sp. HCMS5-2]MCZ4244963.1 hypothetical protein [Pedobacter sp. HCMS5-2]
MKTAEEIAIKHGLYHSYTKEADDKAIAAMKEYANQKLEEAADISEHEKLHYIWQESASDNTHDSLYSRGKAVAFGEIRKSILELKDEI